MVRTNPVQGQCINHVFIPLNAPSERIFVNVIPSGFKNHAMIIGGISIKEWKLKSNKKRIPEYLIKDSKFINTLINEVGDYVEGDSVSCLSKLKEKVWELVLLWKDKGKKAHLSKNYRNSKQLHKGNRLVSALDLFYFL